MTRLPALFLAAALPAAAAASTFTVVSAGDSGAGTLRQAILDANASLGADVIAFAIPGPGVHTIAPATPLPSVLEALAIDATTQPGFDGAPRVALDGALAGVGSVGIELAASGGLVRGLAIVGFDQAGVRISGGTGSAVEGCYVGLEADGATGHGNGFAGISIETGGNRIGGTAPGARNVIAGQPIGVFIDGPGQDNRIEGNFLGTNAGGSAAVASSAGILTRSPATRIGGAAPGEGNLVSGHLGNGIQAQVGADDTVIEGNRVGTDATGTRAVPNTGAGIDVAGADRVRIGGSAAGAGNLVSGNGGKAIAFLGIDGVIVGNLVGTDAAGVEPLPNAGGLVVQNAENVLVGGGSPGEANVIAFNGGPGVWVGFSAGVAIRFNSIHDNRGMGIDLARLDAGGGPTANDPADVDEGGNHLQNFPILETVEIDAGQTHVAGVLRSALEGVFTIDFYADLACARSPAAPPQARRHLGSVLAVVEGHLAEHAGEAHFDVALPGEIAEGEVVTATATDAAGNTSEIFTGIVFRAVPSSGAAEGGSALAILGSDFEEGATVAVGGVVVSSSTAGSEAIAAVTPALSPGTLADITVLNPSGIAGTLPRAYVADFLDVPAAHAFHDDVVRLVLHGITGGVGAGLYGVDGPTLRQQMAVFLLRARHGLCYAPPPCASLFSDVPCPSAFADWIEALAAEGITGGCGGGRFCPQDPVRRDQMAVFLLKAKHGPDYAPPACAGAFADVPCPGPFADWIEELAAEGITGGCGGSNYCPGAPATRGQIAVFLVKTFALQ